MPGKSKKPVKRVSTKKNIPALKKTAAFKQKRKVVNVVESMSGLGDKVDGDNQEHQVKDATLSSSPEVLQQQITDLINGSGLGKKELEVFSKLTNITRRTLAGVGNTVGIYYKLKDDESKLAKLYSRFIVCCDKTEEVLETENHALGASYIDTVFEEWGQIIDDSKKVFKMIKDKFPDNELVINYLDFVDGKTVTVVGRRDSFSNSVDSSESAALGKGEEYAKKKVPKLKKEIETRYNNIVDNFQNNKVTSLEGLSELVKKLENLEEKLSNSGSFDAILKELFTYHKDSVVEHEVWQTK